jgi:ankyrin repeat protein
MALTLLRTIPSHSVIRMIRGTLNALDAQLAVCGDGITVDLQDLCYECDYVNILQAKPRLSKACSYGAIHMVKYALSTPDTYDIESALVYSIASGHLELVKYIVSLGVDIRAHKNNAVRIACASGCLDVVQYLISVGADALSADTCALVSACDNGHLEIVKYLVGLGIDVCTHNDWAISSAFERNNIDIVRYLVSVGANVHAINEFDITIALDSGYTTLVEYIRSVKN